jgi:hypothetical protein
MPHGGFTCPVGGEGQKAPPARYPTCTVLVHCGHPALMASPIPVPLAAARHPPASLRSPASGAA